MPRPLRPDYPGATHHIFVRGVARSAVAVDAADYERALFLLERAVTRVSSSPATRGATSESLPPPRHVAARQSFARDALARNVHGRSPSIKRHGRSATSSRGGSARGSSITRIPSRARPLRAAEPGRARLCVSEDWPWSSYAATAGLRSRPVVPRSRVRSWVARLRRCIRRLGWRRRRCRRRSMSSGRRRRPAAFARRAPARRLERVIAPAHFRHGYSQAAIARHLGVSRSQICRRLASCTARGQARNAAGSGPRCAGQTPVSGR